MRRSHLLAIAMIMIMVIAFQLVAYSPSLGEAVQTYVTMQDFENGKMLWQSNNHDVWVLLNSHTAYRFPTSTYDRLPDNAIAATSTQQIRPLFAFGKVWGNFAAIRTALGWPIRPEIGFNTGLYAAPGTASPPTIALSVVQLDGRTLSIIFPQTGHYQWVYSDDPYAPNFDMTTQAAFQTFDKGYMIWRADTEEVMVFQMSDSNPVTEWGVIDYAQWSDPTGTSSQGHVMPINALGKVWNHAFSPNLGWPGLGWTTAPEQGYTARIKFESITHDDSGAFGTFTYSVSIPDGRKICIFHNTSLYMGFPEQWRFC